MSRKDGKVREKNYDATKADGIRSSNSAPAAALKNTHMEGERHWMEKHRTHALLFIRILSVYILTISPSVSGGDAGELLAPKHTTSAFLTSRVRKKMVEEKVLGENDEVESLSHVTMKKRLEHESRHYGTVMGVLLGDWNECPGE